MVAALASLAVELADSDVEFPPQAASAATSATALTSNCVRDLVNIDVRHPRVRYPRYFGSVAMAVQPLAPTIAGVRQLREEAQMARLDGKVCIITGGARGQGGAEAALFRAEGAQVVITDVLADAGQAHAAAVGATFIRHDVRSEEEIGRASCRERVCLAV